MNLIASLEAELRALLEHFGIMKHADATTVLNKVAADLRTGANAVGGATVSVAKALANTSSPTVAAVIVPLPTDSAPTQSPSTETRDVKGPDALTEKSDNSSTLDRDAEE